MGQDGGIMLTERSKHEDVSSQRSGTMNDKEDMRRVGREQELNVRLLWIFLIVPNGTWNNNVIEKLPVSVCAWLYCSADVHLGSCSLVSKS